MYEPLVVRVAARYLRATDFPSEKARKDYLKEHPGADPSKHTVKEADPSEKAQGWLARATNEIKSFFTDPKARKEGLTKAADKLKAAPRAAGLNVMESVKRELGEAKTAFDGLKAVMSGGTLDDKQMAALKKVAIKATSTLVSSALVAAFPAVLASGPVGKQIAKHITKTVMTRALGGMTGVKLAGILQGAPEAWLGEALARQVAQALSNLSEGDLREILEASADGDDSV